MRKVYVTITARIQISADDGVDISEVIDEMDYKFASQTDGAVITDESIEDYEIQDWWIF